MSVSFIAKGPDSTSADLTAMTPPLPAGAQYDDLYLVIAIQGPTTGSLGCTTPGWTAGMNIGWKKTHRIAAWWARQASSVPVLPTITKKGEGPSIASIYLFRGVAIEPFDPGNSVALTNGTSGNSLNTAAMIIQNQAGGYILHIAEVGQQIIPPAFAFADFSKLGADSVSKSGEIYTGYSLAGAFLNSGSTGAQIVSLNYTLSGTYPASGILIALTPAPQIDLMGALAGSSTILPLELIVASVLAGAAIAGSAAYGDLTQTANLDGETGGSSNAEGADLTVASRFAGAAIGYAAANVSLLTFAWEFTGDANGAAVTNGILTTAGEFTGTAPGSSGPIPPANLTTIPASSGFYALSITMQDASKEITIGSGSNVRLR